MTHGLGVASLIAFAVLAVSDAQCADSVSRPIALDGCAIVVDHSQPTYVRHMLGELRDYLQDITGGEIPVCDATPAGTGAVIVVGPAMADRLTGGAPSVSDLGDEGYVIRSTERDGRTYLTVSGAGPQGTKFGLAALMRMVSATGGSARIDGPFDVRSKPSFPVRGMHFNGWAFNYPYTFRSWKEDDWKSYLDVLTHSGVNLLYIWPFMEIMPTPLSKEDTEYLQEVRRIVDYAQREHGMQVWLMQAANRVATSDLGVSDPRLRPYWRLDVQRDRNPADPAEFETIMKSHEALYRIVDNMDGVCTIDSDPGGWQGSPVSDLTKILQGCRGLLDKYSLKGRDTKLINWMWMGWGRTGSEVFSPSYIAETMRAMKSDVSDPWMLIAGIERYLPSCREEGTLGRTVYLPYNTIECEPSYPATSVGLGGMRTVLGSLTAYQDLGGVMGNVQTPILQFPHLFYWNSTAWDYSYRDRADADVLLDVSRQLYPEHAQLIADCYAAVEGNDPARAQALADTLDGLMSRGELGHLGVFSRSLFPDGAIVARSLVMQLRLRAAQEWLLRDASSATSREDAAKLIERYLDAYLTWDIAHGWHNLWKNGWELGNLSSDGRFGAAAMALRRAIGAEDQIEPLLRPIAQRLNAKYGEEPVTRLAVEPMRKVLASAVAIESIAQKAVATASVEPNPAQYPASAANDGRMASLYWPGALVHDNTEWLQLTWDAPQTFSVVNVYFLAHQSMFGRTIRLQRETAPGVWEDFATTRIPTAIVGDHSVAEFRLPSAVTLDKLRVVNLLDLFEIDIR